MICACHANAILCHGGFRVVLYVLRKTLWGCVPIKPSLGGTLCEWMRKQASSTSTEPAGSRTTGGWEAGPRAGVECVQDLGKFFAWSQGDEAYGRYWIMWSTPVCVRRKQLQDDHNYCLSLYQRHHKDARWGSETCQNREATVEVADFILSLCICRQL